MATNKKQIIITDETILTFYKENPELDLIAMNHIFIGILKKLSSNLSTTLNATINSQILTVVTNLQNEFNLNKTNIILQLNEIKKDYIEDIKTIITNNSLLNNEKLNHLIEKNNDNLLTKTTLIVGDIIPKSQEKNYLQIENCIKTACSTISKDTTKLLEVSNSDNSHFDNIVKNVELQLTSMITHIQQPIFNYIQSSEERTNNGIQNIQEKLNTSHNNTSQLTNEISDFLNKYKNNSSTKGNVSEAELYSVLQSIMPSDEIVKVNTDTATCDLKVIRMDKTKPSILFENKDYARSVPTEEIKKFERDIQLQKIHGIFISHKSPITFKQPFHIDIISGLIHIYIPNAEYDANKIKIAIDIIDSLSFKLTQINNLTNKEEYIVDKEDIEEIVNEYNTFASNKLIMIDTIKSVTKQLIDKMEDIQLPKLKKLFIKLGNIENDNEYKCTICNCWSGKNKASLGAHMRNCKTTTNATKKELTNDNISTMETIENIQLQIATTNEPAKKTKPKQPSTK